MKRVFIALCIIAAALAAVLAAFLGSARLQTMAAAPLLAEKFPGSEIGSVRAGLGGAEAEGLRLPLPDGTEISLKSAKIKYSLAGLISKNVDVESAQIEGLLVKLAPGAEKPLPQAAEKSAASAPAHPPKAGGETGSGPADSPSALQTLSEWAFRLGSLKADASVLAPDGSGVSAELSVSGLNIEKGLKPVSGNAQAKISAESPGFGREEISAKMSAGRARNGPKIAIELLRKNSRLAAFEGEFSADFSEGSASARADATDADFAAFKSVLGKLPQFEAAVFAKIKYSDFGKSARADGTFKIGLPSPASLSEKLGFLGPCGLSGEISGGFGGGSASVEKFSAIFSEGSKSLVSAGLSSPVKIPLPGAAAGGIPRGKIELVAVIPAKIPAHFAKNAGADLSSSGISGRLSVETDGEKVFLETLSPFAVSGLSLSKGGEDFLKNIAATLSLRARADFGGNFYAGAELTAGDSLDDSATLKISAAKSGRAVSAEASLKGSIDPFAAKIYSVANLREYRISVDSSLRARLDGKTATLEGFSFEAFDKGGRRMAKISGESAVGFDLQTKKISSKSKTLAKFEAKEFPFAPIKPFAAGVDAESVSAEGTLSMPDESSFSASANAAVKSLYYRKDGRTMLADISAKTDFEAGAALDLTRVWARVGKCEAGSGGSEWAVAGMSFEGAAKPEFAVKSAEAEASVSLPALLAQPALAQFANLSSGNASVRARAGKNSASVQVRLDNLKTRSVEGALDNVSASAELPLENGFKFSRVSAKLEANSSRGRTEASVKISGGNGALKVDADAKSAVVEDLMLLSKAFSNPNAAAAQAAGESAQTGRKKIVRPAEASPKPGQEEERADIFAAKDPKAFWDFGKKIEARARIGDVFMDSRPVLSDAEASFESDESRLALKLSKASVLGAALDGELEASFDANAEIPYKIPGMSARLKNFEASKIFADAKNPMISGVFEASISARGGGNNARHLFKYLTGAAALKSPGGVVRLLPADTAAGATADIAGTALKITGAILDKNGGAVSGVGDLIKMFSKLEYDSVDFEISRGSRTYDFEISSAVVKTPDIMLSASSGAILFNPDAPFSEYSLDIPVNIYAFDTPARKAFTAAGFAREKSEKAENAYDALSFKIYGTISKPENDLLGALLGGRRKEDSDGSANAVRELGSSIIKSLFKKKGN